MKRIKLYRTGNEQCNVCPMNTWATQQRFRWIFNCKIVKDLTILAQCMWLDYAAVIWARVWCCHYNPAQVYYTGHPSCYFRDFSAIESSSPTGWNAHRQTVFSWFPTLCHFRHPHTVCCPLACSTVSALCKTEEMSKSTKGPMQPWIRQWTHRHGATAPTKREWRFCAPQRHAGSRQNIWHLLPPKWNPKCTLR